MLAHFAQGTRHDFQGLLMLPHSLDGWEPRLTGELVTSPSVAVGIMISHFQPEGSAWGRTIVYVVFAVL